MSPAVLQAARRVRAITRRRAKSAADTASLFELWADAWRERQMLMDADFAAACEVVLRLKYAAEHGEGLTPEHLCH